LIRREILIQNKLGLHARAASKLVAVAKEYASRIEITSPSASADGKSIMKVMLLQASLGTQITVEAEGDDEVVAMDAIESLINNRFDEAE
jgi:phosphocarrier protein